MRRMYKVAIVDDDRIIRRGLANTIAWEENGFTLVGEAADGEQGLRIIGEFCPQVVVSDIKMPFMDGLEMARAAKEKYPDIKIILLTGYDDFSYAKEAIELRAFDYLMKPVDKEVLLSKVKKAAAEWAMQKNIQDKISEGMPFFRQQLLKKLLKQTQDPEQLRQEGISVGIPLDAEAFAVLVVKIDDYCRTTGDMEEEINQGIKQDIVKVCNEVVDHRGLGCTVALEQDELMILYASSGRLEETEDITRELAERVRDIAKERLGKTVSIACGRCFHGIASIPASYEEARRALEFRHVIGKDKVFSVADINILSSQESQSFEGIVTELIRTVRLGFSQEAVMLVKKLEEEMACTKQVTLNKARFVAVQCILSLYSNAQEWAKEWQTRQQEQLDRYYSRINGMQTVADIIHVVMEVVTDLAEFIAWQRENQRCPAVSEAVSYIEANYAQNGLSLQEVAKHVHMNPVYMSTLFKQEKNITFSEFVLETRMKKAMELLRLGGMKAYEVAERVGYNNPEYFSVCFKKYTGVSPVEYRNKT